jgi:hypothetical protein
MQQLQKITVGRVALKDSGAISQSCDYCRRNYIACRQKLPGTCFNCAKRKKKCRYSGKSMSTGRKHCPRPIDTAETQPDVPQSPVTSSFGGEEHQLHLNPDSPADHVTGPQECATFHSRSQMPPAPSTPVDRRDSRIPIAVSTVQDDVDLPPSRTIRSSSLVKRRTEDAPVDESAKRLRVLHSM